jgi:hypothetical protein
MKTTALPMVEDKDAQRVADALSNVLADTFGLYLKTHSFHRKDFRSRLLGSVAKSVLENAPCSVEVVRARRKADPTDARQIIARAKHWGAELIVLGTNERRGFSRLLFGSTSAAVAKRAHCSVRVVREKDAAQTSTAKAYQSSKAA